MKHRSLPQFIKHEKRLLLKTLSKSFFWFFAGVFLGLFLISSFTYLFFEKKYQHVVYPGVSIGGTNFGDKTEEEVKKFYDAKNQEIQNIEITFKHDDEKASSTAGELQMGYNSYLLAQQAFSIGRSQDVISNISIALQAYFNGINLTPSYSYSSNNIDALLQPIKNTLTIQPADALFTFNNGKVTAFQPSSDGQAVDGDLLQKNITSTIPHLFISKDTKAVDIAIPVKILKPQVTTDKANNLGIKELIASGTSLFQHSIETRIFNVELAASRLNGILVAPGEIFSFDKALGDVSSFTGYKQAYVIQNGKTVLGDGGGVCQVSTTLFRAVLNAGLPVLERHAHAYRVGYYEEDSPAGLDATVYVPTVDLKFKNDTDHSILIQTVVDPDSLRLTFNLYGTKDGRTVTITTPVVSNLTPAPPDLYQDDPTLPKGTIKQVDFAAGGATSTFSRTVEKDGKTLISEKYVSNYQPWQAIFLRGTKE